MTLSVTPARPAADDVRSGMLLVTGFACLIPFVEGAAKALGEGGMAAPQITFVRFLFQVVVIGAVIGVLNRGRIGPTPRPGWAFVLRGALITLGSGLLYAGLAYLPMADSTALFFVQPLVLTALSALLLREAVGWRRWGAVAVGLAGALLIAGPNLDRVGWAALLPVGAALSFSGAVLLTRRFAAQGSALTFQFTTSVTAVVLLGLTLGLGTAGGIAALTPVWPTPVQMQLMLVVSVFATCTNLMLTQAFRVAPSSALAPFLYLEIVGAAIMGAVAFGDLPEPRTVAGAVLVVAAGLTVWWRESRRKG